MQNSVPSLPSQPNPTNLFEHVCEQSSQSALAQKHDKRRQGLRTQPAGGRFLRRNSIWGDEELAQWAKPLPQKRDDLHVDPSTHIQSWAWRHGHDCTGERRKRGSLELDWQHVLLNL